MELHFKNRAYAAATTALLLLCFYGSPPPVAAANAVSRSVHQLQTESGETPFEQHSERGSQTPTLNEGAYEQQNEPVGRQHPESFNLLDLEQGWPGGAGGRSEAASTRPSARGKVMTEAPVASAVRTRTQEEEEEEEGNELTSTTEVPVTMRKTHRVPHGTTEELQMQQVMSKRRRSHDRMAAFTQGEETRTKRLLPHRLNGRRLSRPHATRLESNTTAKFADTPSWQDEFSVQLQREQEQEEQNALSAFPMRPTSEFNWSPDLQQIFDSQQQHQSAQQAENLSDEQALMAKEVIDGMKRMTAGDLELARSAEEDERDSQVLLEPPATKMEVLFRSSDTLGVRYTATGNLLCTNGGVYGFAISAGPGDQEAGERGSSPRVQLQRKREDVVVLVGEGGSAAAAENSPLEVPFSTTVSESAAAAASQKNSRLVLLCTAPGQPVVALPAKDVNAIKETVLEQKEADLRKRAACLLEAAAWRRTERHMLWMRYVSRLCLMLSLGALMVSMVSLTRNILVRAEKREALLAQLAEKNPAAIAKFLRSERSLERKTTNMSIPQHVIDTLPDRPNSTLPELRNVRQSFQSLTRVTRLLGFVVASNLLLAVLNRGITRARKYMNRKRTLVLQGLPLDQIDAITAREEAREQLDTAQGHTPTFRATGSAGGDLRSGRAGEYRYVQETPGLDDNMRHWQTPYSAAIHKEHGRLVSVHAANAKEDAIEEEDRSFFEAVRNVEKHWNAAALLTPDQLEQYNLVLVIPKDVSSKRSQGRTRLLLVYEEGQEQTPNSAYERQHGAHEQRLEQALLPQQDVDAEHNEHEWL